MFSIQLDPVLTKKLRGSSRDLFATIGPATLLEGVLAISKNATIQQLIVSRASSSETPFKITFYSESTRGELSEVASFESTDPAQKRIYVNEIGVEFINEDIPQSGTIYFRIDGLVLGEHAFVIRIFYDKC